MRLMSDGLDIQQVCVTAALPARCFTRAAHCWHQCEFSTVVQLLSLYEQMRTDPRLLLDENLLSGSSVMMSLLVVSLLPVVVLMTSRFRSPLLAMCSHVCARILKLSHRKVCVSSTHAYVFSNCTHGQSQSVLLTFDLYSSTHASLNIGPQKGEFLDEIVKREAPLRVLELGMHCGYASVRILRLLPPSGKLLTVEVDPLTADKGEEIILVAGFKNPQFRVLTCSSDEAISSLSSHLGDNLVDLVLMDHDPEQYLPDLLALQRGKLLSASCVVLINRSLTSGAKVLLDYVTARPQSYSVGKQLDGLMELHCYMAADSEGSEY